MIQPDVPQQELTPLQAPVIKLIGVGGGGCNAVEQMIAADIHGVEFTCVNTDAQALAKYNPDHVIQLGSYLTRGLGAGTDPEVGRLAAEEDKELIAAAISNTDMLFLTAGMGGGTGTGAIPVIARIARELGVLTVAVVTKPFGFEGGKRHRVAEVGITQLREHVDSLIVVPNENLLTHLGPNISLIDAFSASNDVLTNAVQSIAELITNPGLINVDFADVKSVMTEMGEAMMSTGRGIGDFRARDAAIAATESPLLDEIDLKEARGILANITASSDLSMGEFQIVGEILDQITADDANVVIGTVFDQRMKDEIRVTVVATGLKSSKPSRSVRTAARPQRQKSQTPGKKKSIFQVFNSPKKEQIRAPLAKPTREETSALKRKQQEDNFRLEQVKRDNDEARQIELAKEKEHHIEIDRATARAEEIAGICTVCGNPPTAHTANCPRRPSQQQASGAFEFAGAHVVRDQQNPPAPAPVPNTVREDFDVDHLRTSNPVMPEDLSAATNDMLKERVVAKPKAPKRPNLYKHIAGLAAGAAVVVSIFYVVATNKLAVNGNDLVSNSDDVTSLAERKLKAANRRLTGIDE